MPHTDPFTGTWRCTLDPWTLPFPKPQSWTVHIRVDGKFIAIVENIVQSNGNPFAIGLRAAFDGHSYPVTGSPTVDAIAYQRLNETTIEGTGQKSGAASMTVTLTVGDTLTVSGTLHMPAPTAFSAVFERVQPDSHAELVYKFLLHGALDWRTGDFDRARKTHTAARLLARHPEIARENIFTAAVCGDLEAVRHFIAERPAAAAEPGGPHAWPPLLYLCNSRFGTDNTLEIARLLLDHGADPNTYYPGGHPSIHYTALTCALGRGEEQADIHPHARELATLLFDRGAEPYDIQVLYNVFAGHASQRHLGAEAIWLLDMIRERSIARGHQSDWDNPDWPMLDIFGGNRGAAWLLKCAMEVQHKPLAEWVLSHGGSPKARPANRKRESQFSLYEMATMRGLSDFAAMLAKHGASTETSNLDRDHKFTAACMKMDAAEAGAMMRAHPDLSKLTYPMRFAAETNRPDVIAFLVDQLGFSVDMEDPDRGRAHPLHDAAYYDSLEAAIALIERGAQIDFYDQIHDASPLWWALFGRKPRMIELLSEVSSDLWALTVAGKAARIRQVLHDCPDFAKTTYRGTTPLFQLPDDEATALDIIDAFLAHGADPAMKNPDGDTAADRAQDREMDQAAARLRQS
jgi:uncharacterized protein